MRFFIIALLFVGCSQPIEPESCQPLVDEMVHTIQMLRTVSHDPDPDMVDMLEDIARDYLTCQTES